MTLSPSLPPLTRLAALFGAALALLGCDSATEGEDIVGVGQVWAYASPTKSAVVASYRHLVPFDRDCPPAEVLDEEGRCSFRNCLYAPDEFPEAKSVGRITMNGGVEDVELERLDDGTYSVERDTLLFAGGEELEFEVTGDEVGPGSATVIAPRRVQVTSPVLGEEAELIAIQRQEDFEVSWKALPEGLVRVFVGVTQHFPDTGQKRDWSLGCWFDGADGSGTLLGGEEGLGKLPQVLELSDTVEARLWVGTQADGKAVAAGRWRHWFGVSSYDDADVTIE